MPELEALAAEIAQCTRCLLHRGRTKAVPGEGPEDANIMFIGEAPGFHEDQQGRPFVGAAGNFLEELLESIGLKREDVYIANVIKCRPPGNREPLPVEAANCREYLDEQLSVIRPEYVCCLGAVAARSLLDTNLAIGRLRGNACFVPVYPFVY